MGELQDKLERASKGAVRSMGFGAGAKQRVAPMLLIGLVEGADAVQAKLAADTKLDAAILRPGSTAKKADLDKASKALGKATSGIWSDEASGNAADGIDFQVFSSDTTPISALGGEDTATLMQVVPELDDSLLRTIDLLPVDGFLVSLADADKLTVAQLMRLARVRSVTSRHLFAQLKAIPSKEELEQLRDVGVAAIILDLAGQTAKSLNALREMMQDLPARSPERDKGRSVATLPSISMPGSAAPAEPDDDEEWEDE